MRQLRLTRQFPLCIFFRGSQSHEFMRDFSAVQRNAEPFSLIDM
jgi:hypothetical protein